MLKESLILDNLRVLSIEYQQSMDEGKDMMKYQARINEITSSEESYAKKEESAGMLLDEMDFSPVNSSFKYKEPSTLPEIIALLPFFDYKFTSVDFSTDTLFDRIYGAWLGRCAGCLLGQPIEGWSLNQIHALLKDTGNYPLSNYISSNVSTAIKEQYGIKDEDYRYGNKPAVVNWINNVECGPEDDDLNYTIIALYIMETYGKNFNADDVAESWLSNIPLLSTFTAERIAYRNLSLYRFPPQSATYRNPYREWIGAQIRGDFWGYINPGNIELAAEMAFRDASISHTKNGIYGEMFISAMVAACWISDDMDFIIRCGLSRIPETSRLYSFVSLVLKYKRDGLDENEVVTSIHSFFNEKLIHHWCHVIPNAMIVCFALLYGNNEFEKSVSLAVMAAFDTDCNAATVGSITGLVNGAKGIPEKWVSRLNDTVESGVKGFKRTSISSLATRTLNVINHTDKRQK